MEFLKFQFVYKNKQTMNLCMYTCRNVHKRSKALKKLLIPKCHVFRRQEIAGANVTWRPSKSSSFEHISGDLVLSCSITYYLLAEAWFTHCTWQTYASENKKFDWKWMFPVGSPLTYCRDEVKCGQELQRGGSQVWCSWMSTFSVYNPPLNV